MSPLARHRLFRLTLIVLYAMATALVAATLPTRSMFGASSSGVLLPDGEVAVLCHTIGDGTDSHDGTAPDGTDHRACCATCVIAGAPGLAGVFDPLMSLPRAGSAVEAGFVVSERTAIDLLRPTSRGPPAA